MKKILLACCAFGITMASFAQTDTTQKPEADTIKIGGIIIINKGGKHEPESKNEVIINHRSKPTNIKTNWAVLDLGFANYYDATNYASAEAQAIAPGFSNKGQLDLRNGKSVNFNLWFFMQRLNLVKHMINLKYGLGIELNNYHFEDETIHFEKNPTRIFQDPSYSDVDKNKLAADYITIPLMLNINFTPDRERGFGLSGGVSAGYLYSSRQKIKTDGDVDKEHGSFGLNAWKLSYIGELNLGLVKLYGSYAFKSMWDNGLNQRPYNVGVRFSGF